LSMDTENKGSAWLWGAFVILLLMFSLIYTFFGKAFSSGYDELIAELAETNSTTESKFSSGGLYSFSILSTLWNYFLIIFIIGLMVWIFVQIQKRGEEYA